MLLFVAYAIVLALLFSAGPVIQGVADRRRADRFLNEADAFSGSLDRLQGQLIEGVPLDPLPPLPSCRSRD